MERKAESNGYETHTIQDIDAAIEANNIPPGARLETWGDELVIVTPDSDEPARRVSLVDIAAWLAPRWGIPLAG